MNVLWQKNLSVILLHHSKGDKMLTVILFWIMAKYDKLDEYGFGLFWAFLMDCYLINSIIDVLK